MRRKLKRPLTSRSKIKEIFNLHLKKCKEFILELSRCGAFVLFKIRFRESRIIIRLWYDHKFVKNKVLTSITHLQIRIPLLLQAHLLLFLLFQLNDPFRVMHMRVCLLLIQENRSWKFAYLGVTWELLFSVRRALSDSWRRHFQLVSPRGLSEQFLVSFGFEPQPIVLEIPHSFSRLRRN